MKPFEAEVQSGQRFEFGKNWQNFLSALTDERIRVAEASIKEMLKIDHLRDQTVLDIGSGSGLFSLAARNLGAKVHSFDYDPASVACTQELQSRYYPNDPDWMIEEGSVLDKDYLHLLGHFDIVYSWGVLHHTGNMWSAIENAASLVKKGSTLFIAIYNDQGIQSKFWEKVKEFYCRNRLGKITILCLFIPYFFSRALLKCIVKKENVFARYKKKRGMSITHDWIDWLGGFPFEVASVEEMVHFLQERGFGLKNICSTKSLGNNQFVFVRD